jgi:dihydrolipoamide dehydrogenase
MFEFDVVVIGSGVGGYNAAIRAGQLGLKVACVEKEKVLGGTCLNVGCMPSKALLHASELYELALTEFASLGIKVKPRLDLPTMMAQKSRSVADLVRGLEILLLKNKVKRIDGVARLDGPGRVIVERRDGSTCELATNHVVIATGSYPAGLPGVDIDQHRIVDSAGALTLSAVPRRLAVIGGGIIGLELGSIWRRLGANVDVIECLDRIISGADEEIAQAFVRSLSAQGMKVHRATRVTGVSINSEGVNLTTAPVVGGDAEVIQADVVLVAIGRRPYTDGLGLETVDIVPDADGFIPTKNCRTTAERIWAVGDVTRGPMLAHKAEEEAIVCIEMVAGQDGRVDYGLVPNVIYTKPEIAWVGMTEEQAKTSGISYKVGRFPFAANARTKLAHESEGFVKVISDSQDLRILGVHMVGPSVSEMIGEACVAMKFGADSEDIGRISHPHPTRSEALRQAAMAVDGWAMQI